MKPREYCCCAIPMINAGIYTALVEQFVLGLLTGILALATPSIVGAATPSFAPWILAIICFVASAIQVLGFIGVSREKPILYRRYVTLHGLVTVAAFAVAGAWVIISATKHSTAKSKCTENFFSGELSGSSEGDTLCTIFPWVDVGIMGGLWLILVILQVYLYVVVSSYGTSQRRDHDKYDQLYDPTRPLNSDSIQMNNRTDPWDSRPSTESLHSPEGRNDRDYKHLRQTSAASASDVMSQPYQEPKDSLSNADYGYQTQTAYPPYSDGQTTNKPAYPSYAYTQEPGPTPQYNDNYYSGPSSNVDRPAHAQSHPGESGFKH
ncbi:hypothetical protein BDQ12DRAFT_678850 [Crucibulum laeve]|uniref:Uncharacterized protein n=1 Tax=Crucibulum laeve TaxID=68775 RepID=A0A5C3M6Q1_9AGAR|nr:hypothetical protein BDQ12DRAFT_678850 [Crucibulum laeve]